MISATFVDALRRPLVSGKSPFEELSSAPGALKSTFSRHNSLVLKVLTDTFRGLGDTSVILSVF
jgi:hypothetical protein